MIGWLSEGGVVGAVEEVPDGLDDTAVEAGCTTGLAEGEPIGGAVPVAVFLDQAAEPLRD